MADVDLDEVTRQLQKTSVGSTSGVSFKGKSLKLNTEDDAKEVVEAIESCANLHYLDLEGNSLGVDSSKAIGKALESHSELKEALWKDLFTGRMKTEIPKALEFLGGGLMSAGARLTVLDLSDNAFGPIGVGGLVVLLQSCYSLEVLKLNNNGLGITGGKMLAKGLLDCYRKSKESGSPLALQVFVAGRNRLENDGARALAEVFKKVGTLRELHMPQNGIYHVGISALSDALKCNPNLEVLNLNDNTVTFRGIAAIASVLPTLQNLKEIDLGDCLLRTKGAVNLAIALTEGHRHLEKLILDCNEIGANGGVLLAKAMKNKNNLVKLSLNGNQFGEQGRNDLCSELKKNGQYEVLDSLDEDEEEEEEEDEDEDEEEEEEEEEDEEEGEEEEEDNISEKSDKAEGNDSDDAGVSENTVESNKCSSILQNLNLSSVSVSKFLENCTPEYFMELGDNRTDLILQEVTRSPDDEYLEKLLSVLMKVSSMSVCDSEQVREAVFSCSNILYKELFSWARKKNKSSIVNNALLVHLGLIKSEDKSLKLTWNIDGCLNALDDAMSKSLIPEETQEIVHVFRGRKVIDVENGTVLPV